MSTIDNGVYNLYYVIVMNDYTKQSDEIYAFTVTITDTVDCALATLTPPTVTNPPVYYYTGVAETLTVGSFTSSIPACVIDPVTCSDLTVPAGFTGNFC